MRNSFSFVNGIKCATLCLPGSSLFRQTTDHPLLSERQSPRYRHRLFHGCSESQGFEEGAERQCEAEQASPTVFAGM